MKQTFKNTLNLVTAYRLRVLSKLKNLASSIFSTRQPIRIENNFYPTVNGRFYDETFPNKVTRPQSLSLFEGVQSNHFLFRLTGHAKGHYSLAIVNRALAIALNQCSNNQALFVPFDDGVKKTLQQLPEITDRDLCSVINNKSAFDSKKPIVSIVHHYPVITDDEAADLRFILFFWEETSVPAATVALLNQQFDAILVAAEFVAIALRNSGCFQPIFVIPMGVDHLVDYTAPLMTLQEIGPGQPFRFLHVSSVFDRKGPEFLLASFIQQFDANDHVELYIKTFPNPHNRIHQQLAQISKTKKNPPRVIIDENEVSKESLNALYRSSHTLVLPTRGEGFNLPAAEALALGLPVIVTGFGAHTDFCTTHTASLIPFHFDFSQSHLKSSDSCWVTPDTRALSSLLQEAYDEVINPSEAWQQRRKLGYTLMRSTYTWNNSVEGITNALHWLTLHRTSLQSNKSELLIEHIPSASLETLATYSLDSKPVDALIFKLDARLLSADISEALLNNLSKLKQRVILLLELTPDIDSTNLKESFIFMRAFLKCFDRVCVQTLEDFNLMLGSGEIRNVIFLASATGDATASASRDSRIKNMIRGLKHDRQCLSV